MEEKFFYLSQKNRYWKITRNVGDFHKIGYIDLIGRLNVSQELYDEIEKRVNFNWFVGRTCGGTREIKYSIFNSVEECIKELNVIGIILLTD